MFTGPKIIKGDGALGAIGANTDNVHGFAYGGAPLPDVGTYDTFNVGVKLVQASDADAMGFDAAYDASNKTLVRYHIDEYFRLNPNGILWFLLTDKATLTDVCNVGNTDSGVYKLIVDSLKAVRTIIADIAIVDGYAPHMTNGMDADVTTAIANAQVLIDAFRAENVFVDGIVLPGLALSATTSDWGDLRSLAAPNVMVCVAQDKDIADLVTNYAPHAAVGTLLGAIGVRRVEEDLGSVTIENNPNNNGNPDYPINNVSKGLWKRTALSSGTLCKDLSAADVRLIVGYVDGTTVVPGNGMIMADEYPEYAGVYFSKGAACTDAASDYAYFVNTRVWNKAARLAVYKLTPKINSKVQLIDGKIGASTIADWQSDVNNSNNGLGSLVVQGFCTKSVCYINPDQDVFGTSKVIVKMTVTPYGYARDIEGDLGFAK